MGTLDRALRFGAALLIAVLYFTDLISGPVAVVLGIIAAVFVLTSFVGTCPAYLPFRFSTRGRDS